MNNPEHAQIGQCELQCPVRVILGYGARKSLQSSVNTLLEGILTGNIEQAIGPIGQYARLGKAGAEVMLETVVCPSRGLNTETWQPSARCVAAAKKVAEQLRPFADSSLTDFERGTLAKADIYADDAQPPDSPKASPVVES